MALSADSPEDVVNLALTRIGYRDLVNNMYEGSRQANAALSIYAQTRDEMIRKGDWGFARRDVTLPLLKTAPSAGYVITAWSDVYPPLPWKYEYAYPNDCLKVRSIRSTPLFLPNFAPAAVPYTVYSAAQTGATGSVTFSVNPTAGDTVTLNGVSIAFVSGAPVGNQVQVLGTLGLTMANLLSFLLNSTNALLTAAAYAINGGGGGSAILAITGTPVGTGLNYTLAASAAVVSGPTLTNVQLARTLACNVGPTAVLTYAGQVTNPAQWEAGFLEALAAELGTLLAPTLIDPKMSMAAGADDQRALATAMSERG